MAANAIGSRVSEKIGSREGDRVQPSQLSADVSKNYTTRLLPKIGTAFAPAAFMGTHYASQAQCEAACSRGNCLPYTVIVLDD